MTTELVKTNGAPHFGEDQVSLITRTVAKGATADELKLFLYQAERTGLDPLARQIYFIKRGNQGTIQTGIDGFRLIAERSGKYAGQTPVQWCAADGVWRDVWLDREPPAAAKVGVYRKGFEEPVVRVATWSEYSQQSSPMWKKMPALMLGKCFDSETEVLTDKGFQRFAEVTGRVMQVTESGVEPTDAVPFFQNYDGDMITLESDDLNFCVTPNHDMVTTCGKIEAGDMYDRARTRPKFWIPRSVSGSKSQRTFTDFELRLAAIHIADGTPYNKTRFKVSVSRPRKVAALEELGGYEFMRTRRTAGAAVEVGTRVITTKHDKTEFIYDPKSILRIVSLDKRINTAALLEMTREEARIFVDALVEFDGSTNRKTGVRRFYTSRLEHARAFELAAVVAGYAVNVPIARGSDISTKPNFCFTISERDEVPVLRWGRAYHNLSTDNAFGRTGLTKTKNSDGFVWCVTVPSGVIVVRRRGFSMLCGNCAEALALRAAFPQELSGLYTSDEMDQADAVEATVIDDTPRREWPARPFDAATTRAALRLKAERSPQPSADTQQRHAAIAFQNLKVTDEERHAIMTYVFGLSSLKDATAGECMAFVSWIDARPVVEEEGAKPVYVPNGDAIAEAKAILQEVAAQAPATEYQDHAERLFDDSGELAEEGTA